MEDGEEYEIIVFKGLDRADKVREDVNLWMGGKLEKLGCEETKDLTVAKCKAPVKDDLAIWLRDALLLINRQHESRGYQGLVKHGIGAQGRVYWLSAINCGAAEAGDCL